MLFKKLATLKLADATALEPVDAAINAIDSYFANAATLGANQKRQVMQMGDRSENFCRQTLMALAENPVLVPPSLDIAAALADLKTRDLLASRLLRLEQLYKRLLDTDFALGADIMAAAMMGYRQLKIVGRAAGLETLQREVGLRFAKKPRAKAKPQPDMTTNGGS